MGECVSWLRIVVVGRQFNFHLTADRVLWLLECARLLAVYDCLEPTVAIVCFVAVNISGKTDIKRMFIKFTIA